ncbi:hypothetical protein F4806DRAFT_499219 [Annulohypoxylon nitens]|nr:hypothetical protein F4806DRAFT_499219 [Annulohypoxylon nitens]
MSGNNNDKGKGTGKGMGKGNDKKVSANLDQSLDEIASASRASSSRQPPWIRQPLALLARVRGDAWIPHLRLWVTENVVERSTRTNNGVFPQMSAVFFRDRTQRRRQLTARQYLPRPLPASRVPHYRPRGSINARPSSQSSPHPSGAGSSHTSGRGRSRDRRNEKRATQCRKMKAARPHPQPYQQPYPFCYYHSEYLFLYIVADI